MPRAVEGEGASARRLEVRAAEDSALDGWLRALPKILPLRVAADGERVTIAAAQRHQSNATPSPPSRCLMGERVG